MCGPYWAVLHMFRSHDMRHTSFPRVDGGQLDTPGFGASHARPVLLRHHFWVTTQHRKWAVAHPILSLHYYFLFLFVLPIVKPAEFSLITTRLWKTGKLAKIHILYKKEFNYNFLLITNYKHWLFYPDFYKIQK